MFHKKIPYLLLSLISFAYTIKIISLAYPLLINNYPFISSDGYDWITEGLYFSKAMQGVNLSNVILPYARPPIFVFITAVDSFLGENGYGIASALGISFFGMGYFAINSLQKDTNPLFVIIMLIVLLLTPVNFVRKFILSDAICVFLSFGAMYYLFEFYKRSFNNYTQMIYLSFGIAIAGATQIYGLISPLVGLGVLFFISIKDKNILIIKRIFFILIISFTFWVLILFYWYRFIPHNLLPSSFGLIKFSQNMSSFYVQTWAYFFFPLLPLLLGIFIVEKIKIIQDPFLISLWLSVILFMILTFFYQWPESRFTFFYWHLLIIAIFKTFLYINRMRFKFILLGLSTGLIISQSFFLSGNDWSPKLNEITINSRGTWLYSIFFSDSIDRFQLELNCGSKDIICENLVVDINFDDYVRNTMKVYLDIHPK